MFRKYKIAKMVTILFTACLLTGNVYAQGGGGGEGGQQGGEGGSNEGSEGGGGRDGPPPEAFTACDGGSSGSSCTMETPRGSASGTCQSPKDDGKLVCVPEGHEER